MRKPLIIALFCFVTLRSLSAQTHTWQPSPGHTQIPIWPGAAPDPQPVAGPEVAKTFGEGSAGCRDAGRRCEQRVAAYDDGLFANTERIRALRSSSSPAEAIRFWPSTLKAQRSVTG